MVYISKAMPNLYRDRLWTWITGSGSTFMSGSNESRFVMNFYSGELPEDISSTTYDDTVTESFSSPYMNKVSNGLESVTSVTNTKLATISDCSFLTFTTVNEQWVSTQFPFDVEYVADGTIGFFEVLMFGKGVSTTTASWLGSTGTSNGMYNIHPKSAFYGTVGLLGSGSEVVLDKMDITSTSVPKLYEFGLNPQISL